MTRLISKNPTTTPESIYVDSDLLTVVLCAVHYSLGRHTYIPHVMSEYIKGILPLLDTQAINSFLAPIEKHLTDYSKHEPYPALWRDLADWLILRRNELKSIEQTMSSIPNAEHIEHTTLQSKLPRDVNFGCVVNSAIRWDLNHPSENTEIVQQFISNHLCDLDARTMAVAERDIETSMNGWGTNHSDRRWAEILALISARLSQLGRANYRPTRRREGRNES